MISTEGLYTPWLKQAPPLVDTLIVVDVLVVVVVVVLELPAMTKPIPAQSSAALMVALMTLLCAVLACAYSIKLLGTVV